jgi:competence protein ComEA
VFLSSACATLPRTAADQPYASSPSHTSSQSSRININSASADELETLPGVGKVIAERIIEHRQKYGPFHRAAHLMMVRGISDRKFRDLRDSITAE